MKAPDELETGNNSPPGLPVGAPATAPPTHESWHSQWPRESAAWAAQDGAFLLLANYSVNSKEFANTNQD